jgi:hypothetical protein
MEVRGMGMRKIISIVGIIGVGGEGEIGVGVEMGGKGGW